MRLYKVFGVSCVVISLFVGCSSPQTLELWYEQPAEKWLESLPIGNGRLGAIIYGGVEREVIALNESSMWSGEYNPDQEIPFGKEKLSDLRKLFFEGKLEEGNQIAGEYLKGDQCAFGTHLPIGNMIIESYYPQGEITNYRRSLNLQDAIGRVDYKIGGISYSREYLASNPDDLLVFRLTSDKPGSVSFELKLDLLRNAEVRIENNKLFVEGDALFPRQGRGGVLFNGCISLHGTSGEITATENSLIIENADDATIFVDFRTNYKDKEYKQRCKSTITKAENKDFNLVKENHLADYKPLFNRVSLSLGESNNSHLPTDKRLESIRAGFSDTDFDALLFQYGRYLTIASSRENSPLPIALQGFFNDNLACNMGWTNDYHLDINTQQNYWLANIGNLGESNYPLFSYIEDLSVHGAKTAEKIYGYEGWTAHTTANIWGYTAPSGSILWGLFPTAGTWLATHLWSHYEYTQDKEFLRDRAYPLIKGSAKFLLDYLVEDPNTGFLVTGPSISPENSFLYNGTELCASMMPTCDRVLTYEIFSNCIESSEILGIDNLFADSLREALTLLPPIRLRENGGVREWMEDYEEAHPNHRHTTHLLALYPYSQISLDKTPDLAAGARKTIKDRLTADGWEDTEWSRANMICFYARLKDAPMAYESVQMFEQNFLADNLLSISPAGIAGAESAIYAFDGNTASAAGIAEMLMQDHEGYIEFLPCLPEEWSDGYFEGLSIRGGGELDLYWKKDNVREATLVASVNNTFHIKTNNSSSVKFTVNGKIAKPEKMENGIVTFFLKKDDVLKIAS
ncbi:MAG: glycoside hydrolase family 95 protein [Proteiniphilum sp.]